MQTETQQNQILTKPYSVEQELYKRSSIEHEFHDYIKKTMTINQNNTITLDYNFHYKIVVLIKQVNRNGSLQYLYDNFTRDPGRFTLTYSATAEYPKREVLCLIYKIRYDLCSSLPEKHQ